MSRKQNKGFIQRTQESSINNEQLTAREDQSGISSDAEKSSQSWKTRAENSETALRRAETKTTILKKKLGVGQVAVDIDEVNPWISRDDFDALSRGSTESGEALEQIVPTEFCAKDVVVVNNTKKYGGQCRQHR